MRGSTIAADFDYEEFAEMIGNGKCKKQMQILRDAQDDSVPLLVVCRRIGNERPS